MPCIVTLNPVSTRLDSHRTKVMTSKYYIKHIKFDGNIYVLTLTFLFFICILCVCVWGSEWARFFFLHYNQLHCMNYRLHCGETITARIPNTSLRFAAASRCAPRERVHCPPRLCNARCNARARHLSHLADSNATPAPPPAVAPRLNFRDNRAYRLKKERERGVGRCFGGRGLKGG